MASPLQLPALATRELGQHVRGYDVVDSTNETLWEWAQQGAPHGAVCLAACQQRGRGRQGRRWVSPEGGGLYASLLLRPPIAVASLPSFSLVTALVIAESLQLDFGLDAGVKWPNDVWLDGRKLAGVLLESRHRLGNAVVVGMGINLRAPEEGWPTDLLHAAIALSEVGVTTQPDVLLACVLNRLEPAYVEFLKAGFAAFRERWHQRCLLSGRDLTVRLEGSAKDWSVLGIDDEGRLRTRCSSGEERALNAGELHLGSIG